MEITINQKSRSIPKKVIQAVKDVVDSELSTKEAEEILALVRDSSTFIDGLILRIWED